MSRINLHDLPFRYQDQIARQIGAVAPRLPDALPQHHVGPEQVVAETDEGGDAGRITVRITRFGTKLLDADNLAGGTKFLVDALRYQKVIPEDNPQVIRLIVGQRKVKRADIGTLVEISYYETNTVTQGIKEAGKAP